MLCLQHQVSLIVTVNDNLVVIQLNLKFDRTIMKLLFHVTVNLKLCNTLSDDV
uniref:Uncharacterized protein n=1 Tax=Arundo donax TaxID=35708 RepID=A0A0A9G327_ARUDO